MSKIFLNTFHPLCSTKYGMEAIQKFNILPFVDGSCRREPDFEHKYPSITSICRGAKFAPRLQEKDIIVYFTIKGYYKKNYPSHYKMIAILKVIARFESHSEGAQWYKNKGLKIPNNCLVPGNEPIPLNKTLDPGEIVCNCGTYKDNSKKIGNRYLQEWDRVYWLKVQQNPCFIITKKLYMELLNPIMLVKEDIENIFARVPGTRTPPEITLSEYNRLIKYLD